MLPDVYLMPRSSKAISPPVVINPPESPFATELKHRLVCLKEWSSFRRCKRDFPKLDCAVCAAGYAGIPIACDADAPNFSCVTKKLSQWPLCSYIPNSAAE